MASFHDAMKSDHSMIRCFAFFLGVAEANAFSAYVSFAEKGKGMKHGAFRWRLCVSLLAQLGQGEEGLSGSRRQPMVTRSMVPGSQNVPHHPVSIGEKRRRLCKKCKSRTSYRCKCDENLTLCLVCCAVHIEEKIIERYQQNL